MQMFKNHTKLYLFSKEVRQRAAIEKHAWALKGDLTAYFSLWSPYFPLISDNNV